MQTRPSTFIMGGEEIFIDDIISIKLEDGVVTVHYLSNYFLSQHDRRPLFFRREFYHENPKQAIKDFSELKRLYKYHGVPLKWRDSPNGVRVARSEHNKGYVVDNPTCQGWHFVYDDEIQKMTG